MLRINPYKMFPKAYRIVKILNNLQNEWGKVVRLPAVSRYSSPVVLGVNYLIVEVWNDQAEKYLSKMKGTILHHLSRIGYKSDGIFTLMINAPRKKDNTPTHKPEAKKIVVDEGKVRQYMNGAPDTLPEDINYALSHFRAYLDARASVL